MTTYDLCVAWNWPHDAGFVGILEQACRERGLSVLHITPENLDATHQALLNGELSFRAFTNRAANQLRPEHALQHHPVPLRRAARTARPRPDAAGAGFCHQTRQWRWRRGGDLRGHVG